MAHARASGIATLALTDHDTMDGVPDAVAAGAREGVSVVPGVELSARVPVGSMHLLGYFVDPAPAPVLDRLHAFRVRRVERAREMVGRLRAMGIGVSWEDVAARAVGAVGRPHIADALVAAGHAADRRDAFARYIGDDGPVYVPSSSLGPEEAVRLVADAGGAPVLAHPLSLMLEGDALRRFVADLRDRGLRGMEVHRPDHDPPTAALLGRLADDLDLVPTGGSDFHRPDGPVELGDTGSTRLPEGVVAALLDG